MTLSVKFRKNHLKYSTLIGQTLISNVFLVFLRTHGSHFNRFELEVSSANLALCCAFNLMIHIFYRFDPNYDIFGWVKFDQKNLT